MSTNTGNRAQNDQNGLVLIQLEELKNFCKHLENSTKELKDVVEAGSDDPEFITAIKENEIVLKKKYEAIKELEKLILLSSGSNHQSDVIKAPGKPEESPNSEEEGVYL